MKTLYISAAAILAAAGFAGVAQAQEVNQPYGSIGFQNSNADTIDANLNSVNVRGGVKVTPYVGLEGEAAFGTNDDGPYSLTHKVGAHVVGFAPLSPSFDLIGKVGVSDTKVKGPTAKFNEGTALDYGIGGQYHMNQDYSLRADWTRSDFKDDRGTSDTATLSLVKKF